MSASERPAGPSSPSSSKTHRSPPIFITRPSINRGRSDNETPTRTTLTYSALAPPERKFRSRSAPPTTIPLQIVEASTLAVTSTFGNQRALTATATADEDNGGEGSWMAPDPAFTVKRAVSVGSKQYGFTSLGRGFNWLGKEEEERNLSRKRERDRSRQRVADRRDASQSRDLAPGSPVQLEPDSNQLNGSAMPSIVALSATTSSLSTRPLTPLTMPHDDTDHSTQPVSPLSQSPSTYARPLTPSSSSGTRNSVSRSPTSPRPPSRRRSSHKRVSLVAGRVSVIEDPPPLPENAPKLSRLNSQSSFLSVAVSTRPPTPVSQEHYLGVHSIADYVVDGEAGRGAYGMVKRAREKLPDGNLGPPLIIKQVIKSRILADCWKKHPKHGTIPIEIYVMSSISNTSYVLPPRRPWDPARSYFPHATHASAEWKDGAVVNGHPNICLLLDFFEDSHFYYLVMPSSSPPPTEDSELPPSDLFDLVELYPQGLPAYLIRSYLGQLADALCFLHSKDIVHRDIKDENVVLGPTEGKCILIDFGSSGIVRRGGWDTFSGTLDYAGPEILRGESYSGKEQDVWAFGVVAFVLLVGECPFMTPTEAQEGLASPFSKARMALDERCGDEHEDEGEEPDGGGRLGDAHALVMACLQVDIAKRPTFERLLSCRFLSGGKGW